MGAVYSQLSLDERRKIERWRHARVPVDEMARVLKRCRSTIFRELKRNHFSDPCLPDRYASPWVAITAPENWTDQDTARLVAHCNSGFQHVCDRS